MRRSPRRVVTTSVLRLQRRVALPRPKVLPPWPRRRVAEILPPRQAVSSGCRRGSRRAQGRRRGGRGSNGHGGPE
eukprot:5121285-Lingulodinium_polyedra.AAC.1